MSHTTKFFSYYRPYLGTFIAVMICAFIAAGASLLLPLCTVSYTHLHHFGRGQRPGRP